MAVPTWARTLGTAAGTGVVAGAGQLGIAYGLGIVRWDTDLQDGPWHWQLTWLALLASMAVIAGASVGRWAADRSAVPAGLPMRVAVTLAGAVGAAIMVPLVVHPAHAARVSEPGNPALTAVMATSAGLVIGVLAALAVLRVPTVAGNLVATVTWLWLAALCSVVWTIGRGGTWGVARPGLFPASGVWIPVMLLGVPALIALAVAAVARFGGSGPVAVALSGVAGPALLAAAYVVGAPGGGTQSTSYRYALLGVAVAAAVSIVVAVARRPARPVPAPPRDAPAAAAPPEELRGGAHRTPEWTGAPEESTDLPVKAKAKAKVDEDRTVPVKAEDRTEPVKAPVTAPVRATAKVEEAAPSGGAAEPAPEAKRSGRRGRRRGQDEAEPPVSAGDSDYVDWVKALGKSRPSK